MAANWHDGFTLRSVWEPVEGTGGRYKLILTNEIDSDVANIKLCFSGPGRIGHDATITNGKIIAQLSNYMEIAPAAPMVLAPGANWEITIDKMEIPYRHWTDGAVTAFVVFGDGKAVSAITQPLERAGNTEAPKRGTMRLGGGDPGVSVSIIPWPNSVKLAGRRTAPNGLAIAAGGVKSAMAAKDAFRELVTLLFPGEGLVREDRENGLPVLMTEDTALAAEAYRLSFFSHGAKLEASGPTGFLYGLVTLGQMARGARHERQSFSFPATGSIEDAPAMGFRGSHLDVARRFYGVDEVSRFLAIMAWNKLNRFHWHLSDDEAWRVEIKAYPRLTEIGAWRGNGLPLPPLLGSGPERAGGFYSKADVKRLVALAGRFGIEVIPEIDVPGHCYAMLQALPELRDAGENDAYVSIQSFPNNCLNPAVEAVYPALETIFSEMIELFPARWFHVGADEVPENAWASSPEANAVRGRYGFAGAAPLQARFLKRVQEFLTSKGKITGAWEEAAHGGGIDKAHCYLVGWVKVESARELAGEGYDVVVAPGQAYYLDMANGEAWQEPGAGWAGWSSPEKTYGFDPVAGWSDAQKTKLLGVQACIWSEPMTDRAAFDRLVFPRLSAIAETGWTKPENKNFARFAGLADLMPNLYGRREGA